MEFCIKLFFICSIGFLFVSFAVMLGKYELITLVFILLLGALLRPICNKKWKVLEDLPVLGEATKIYEDLEKYYSECKPKPFFYYLLYPVSGIYTFFFHSSENARRELNAYFGLIQWIILLLLVGSFTSYFQIYQYCELDFALQWFYLELLSIYFLCNFFAVPVVTTSLNLSLEKKYIRLALISSISLVVLLFSFYFFSTSSRYDNLIPINIILDKRIASSRQTTGKPDPFIKELQDTTHMFLQHHCPQILKFHRENLFDTGTTKIEYMEQINRLYQKHLNAICPFGENDYFFITANQELQDLWGLIILPFRESICYVFHYKDTLRIFAKWEELPANEQEEMLKRWDTSQFQFSIKKQFARVAVDYIREQMKDTRAQKSVAAKEQMNDIPEESSQNKRESAFVPVPPRSEGGSKNAQQEAYRMKQEVLQNTWKKLMTKLEKELHLTIRIPGQNSIKTFLSAWPSYWKSYEIEVFLQAIHTYKEKQTELESLPLDFEQKIQNAETFTQKIQEFDQYFDQTWTTICQRNRLFCIYDQNLQEFDFPRAIKMKLLEDHLGKSPKLQEHWFTQLYEIFLSMLMFLFRISMPLHILLIVYCRAKLGPIRLRAN